MFFLESLADTSAHFQINGGFKTLYQSKSFKKNKRPCSTARLEPPTIPITESPKPAFGLYTICFLCSQLIFSFNMTEFCHSPNWSKRI
eukprot:UN04555